MAITGSWTKIASNRILQRSSLCTSVVGSKIYIFGGELQPRQPRDNAIHIVDTKAADDAAQITTLPSPDTSPSPRVGSTSTVLDNKLYFFSGRGGEAMAPIDESGAFWAFDTNQQTWSLVRSAASVTKIPEPRSYHCTTSDPTNQKIYIHAGCPEKGRLADLWSFDVVSGEWTQLASAPEPARGGTSMVFLNEKIYRMNGFDGKFERGGAVDVYDVATDSWTTRDFVADGKKGPGARSVAALVSVKISGRDYLVTGFGESDPSSLGHQGAGKMLSDVWAWSVAEEEWVQVVSGDEEKPQARGWFDADVIGIEGEDAVVVAGGLGESNERLDDVWVLKLSL